MSNFDLGRQADLKDIETKIDDPYLSDRQKRKMKRTKARLLEQRSMSDVNNLRRRYQKAIQENDRDAVDKIGSQLQAIDRRIGLDRRKL